MRSGLEKVSQTLPAPPFPSQLTAAGGDPTHAVETLNRTRRKQGSFHCISDHGTSVRFSTETPLTDPRDAQHWSQVNSRDTILTSLLSVKPGWMEKENCVKEALATPSFGVDEEPWRDEKLVLALL